MAKTKNKRDEPKENCTLIEDEYNRGVKANLDGLALDDCPHSIEYSQESKDGKRYSWCVGWLDNNHSQSTTKKYNEKYNKKT